MKTFDEIYEELQSQNNSELNSTWEEAKKEHEKNKKIVRKICIIIDILCLIMIWKLITNIPVIFMKIFFTVFFIIFVAMLDLLIFQIITRDKVNKKQRQFNEVYKNRVINKIMNNFYNNLEYFPNKQMPEYIYEIPKYEYYSIYNSEDYFEAQINNKYSIQMAEILTQSKEEYKDSEGNTQTRYVTDFHGLFAKIQIDKSINSELKIMQNGEIIKKDRLNMDSSEFEKYFDVKASNQITGMQILTSDVMEELIDFENKTKMKFDIFLKDNELYLRFHSGNMFEPGKLKNGPLDKKIIEKYFYMLNFTYNLSNKLINLVNEIEL